MVTIEENHELLDIILGYKPDKYHATFLEVEFTNSTELDMTFELTSPSGEKFNEITTYKLSEVGVWIWKASATNYETKTGTITVTKAQYGDFITIDIVLESVTGDVLIYGTASLRNPDLSGRPFTERLSSFDHYQYVNSGYRKKGRRVISGGQYNNQYQYYNDFNTYYCNVLAYDGWQTLNYYYRTYDATERQLDSVYLLSSSQASDSSKIHLHLINATSGQTITDEINVTAYYNWGVNENPTFDLDDPNNIVFSSDCYYYMSQGSHEVNCRYTYYTFRISCPGYKNAFVNVEPEPSGLGYASYDVFLIPDLKAADIRAVLTWGSLPSDLDSHMELCRYNNIISHVYYSNDYYSVNGVTHVELDVDDTTGYGPETISIYYRDTDFKYYYYIYCFSSHSYGIPSNAKVSIYDGDRLVTTVQPTEHTGSSAYLYWKVFSYDANTQLISVKNEIVNYQPSENNWND